MLLTCGNFYPRNLKLAVNFQNLTTSLPTSWLKFYMLMELLGHPSRRHIPPTLRCHIMSHFTRIRGSGCERTCRRLFTQGFMSHVSQTNWFYSRLLGSVSAPVNVGRSFLLWSQIPTRSNWKHVEYVDTHKTHAYRMNFNTRMHSSRMRTGRTLTVFRKLETTPPKIWSRHSPPQKCGADTPPRKFGADTTPAKIWSRHPPRKFGAGTPPKIWSRPTPPGNLEQAPPPDNLEQAPPPPPTPENLEQAPPPCGQTHACENITLAKTSFRPVITTRVDPGGVKAQSPPQSLQKISREKEYDGHFRRPNWLQWRFHVVLPHFLPSF